MEPDLIYSASSHMKNVVNWNEWKYCGIGADIEKDVIDNMVKEYFEESTLYFVSNRKESGKINKDDLLERVKKELGQNELFVWDVNFSKVIEFSKIGVMRSGYVTTPI